MNWRLHRHTPGLGPINQARLAGFLLPACLAVSPDGVPLGQLSGTTWVRCRHPKTAIARINRVPSRTRKVACGKQTFSLGFATRPQPGETSLGCLGAAVGGAGGALVGRRSYAEHLPAPPVTAGWVPEAVPPEGIVPVERMLLTTLPVEGLGAAETGVHCDTSRWRIERCHIEALQLKPLAAKTRHRRDIASCPDACRG